jgi:hypothetical protein
MPACTAFPIGTETYSPTTASTTLFERLATSTSPCSTVTKASQSAVRRMVETAYGLLVWGELTVEGDLNTPPGYPPAGLSVGTRDVQGPNIFTAWGGRIARTAALKEISIVAEPANHGARILGEWTDF